MSHRPMASAVSPVGEAAPGTTARRSVLILSMRGLKPVLSRCLRFEFEDVVRDLEGADILAPTRVRLDSGRVRSALPFLDAVTPRLTDIIVPGRHSVPRSFDILLCCVESLKDLMLLQPLGAMCRRAHVAVCFLDEVWRLGLRGRSREVQALRQFDRIFLGSAESVGELEEATGRPCRHLPFSVDTLTFCPVPDGPRRVIDTHAMGRRAAGTHQALLDLAARKGWLYLYDTVGNAVVDSHVEHRRRLAGLIGRTRYFLANPGKVDLPLQTGGQQEVGYRFFEGAAGGALLFGEAPRTQVFSRLFDWPDSIIELPYGSGDVERCLQPFEDDPARVERIRITSVVQSLLRHDHAHRWAEVLATLGLSQGPGLPERMNALRERAGLIQRHGLGAGGK